VIACVVVVVYNFLVAATPHWVNAWRYVALFTTVIVALILESVPPAASGLAGLTTAVAIGYATPKPGDAIKWGLSGISDGTIWLIFGTLVVSHAYEKTGLYPWPDSFLV
jgi:L-tartrate/succinate antiporter